MLGRSVTSRFVECDRRGLPSPVPAEGAAGFCQATGSSAGAGLRPAGLCPPRLDWGGGNGVSGIQGLCPYGAGRMGPAGTIGLAGQQHSALCSVRQGIN